MTDKKLAENLIVEGTSIPMALRKRLGMCRWGHPNYFGDSGDGSNIGTRLANDGVSETHYCLACHRDDMAALRRRRIGDRPRSMRGKRARVKP